MRYGRIARRAAPLALLLLAACSAGYPPPEEENKRKLDASIRWTATRRDPRAPVTTAAEALEASLFQSSARTLVAKSIRAHGGWDAWLALGRLSYTRADSPATRFSASVDGDGRLVAETTGLTAAESLIAALPFCLADPAFDKEDLGSEIDLKAGETYERVGFRPAGSVVADWTVAYLDASTFLVRRLVTKKPDGKPVLTVFSDWKPLRGVLFPTRRSDYELASMLEHRDLARPDQVENLVVDEPPR